MKRAMILFLCALAAGCGSVKTKSKSLPETAAELKDLAVAARDEAEKARGAKDPKGAAKAADRSEAAVEKLDRVLAKLDAPSAADRKMQSDAKEAARKARYFAELADEEEQLADALSSWIAKAYRAARGLAMKSSTTALALAAEQAGKNDLESLPASVQTTARQAAHLAQEFSGRKPLPNGDPDWPGIASDLRGQLPPEIHQFLGVAFLLTAHTNFALYEIELVDHTTLKSGRQRNLVHLQRALTYSTHGWRHLAMLACGEISEGAKVGNSDEQFLAVVHSLLAYFHLDNNDYENANREVGRAMRIWPNNPVSVFLTGERLAATGEYEQAAASFEKVTADSHGEWLAKRVAERARQLRDGKDDGETLFHDREFLSRISLHYIAVAAKESPWAARLQQTVQAAKEFGGRMLAHLPKIQI